MDYSILLLMESDECYSIIIQDCFFASYLPFCCLSKKNRAGRNRLCAVKSCSSLYIGSSTDLKLSGGHNLLNRRISGFHSRPLSLRPEQSSYRLTDPTLY